MREIQKLVEAILALILGVVLMSALPSENKLLGLFSFGIVLSAVLILIIYWIIKNFIEEDYYF